MKTIRRILGILVMIAGVLGLVLSLAGLSAVWVMKPRVAAIADTTLVALNSNVTTSLKAMEITNQALGATIDSVDALSVMLDATAGSIEDTQPLIDKANTLMSDQLPAAMKSAISSLEAAQQGAVVMESTIKSLESFQAVMSGVPLLSAFVQQPVQAYDPEVPLADSLGELATSLEDLPDMFVGMSDDLANADDNLATIKASLSTMSKSVGLISGSLSGYQTMVTQSRSSMDSLGSMLSNFQTNLPSILGWAATLLSLFFFWLLAAQVVIFSQGWELFQGTAGGIEGGEAVEPADEKAPQSEEDSKEG
jgi:hypothetical protein